MKGTRSRFCASRVSGRLGVISLRVEMSSILGGSQGGARSRNFRLAQLSRSLPAGSSKEPSLFYVQVFGTEFCKPTRQVLRPEGDGQSPPGARKSLDNMAPQESPLSVPAAPAHRALGSMAKVGAGQSAASPACRWKLWGSPQTLLTSEELGLHVPPFIHSTSSELLFPALCWQCCGHHGDHDSLCPASWGSLSRGVDRPIPTQR